MRIHRNDSGYMGQRDGREPWMRMKIQYAARDWLFVERVDAWFDGTKVPLQIGGFERDHHTTIWEWVDVTPNARQVVTLFGLANASEAILRFSGRQYHKDVTLSGGDKRALREMMAAYAAMTE